MIPRNAMANDENNFKSVRSITQETSDTENGLIMDTIRLQFMFKGDGGSPRSTIRQCQGNPGQHHDGRPCEQ